MLTGVNLLLRFVSTGFQVYLSGCIGAAGIGLLQLVLSVGALSTTAGMAGIRTSTMYLTAEALGKKRPGHVRWVLSGCVTYSILCSSTVAFGLHFFADKLAVYWIGEPATADAIRLYACFVPVFCLCGVMTGYFTAANRIGTLAAVEVAEQFFCMAVTVLFLRVLGSSDPATACQCVIMGSGACACLTLCCLVILRLQEANPVAPRIPTRSPLLQTAVPLALADDLKAGISTTENLMVPKRLALYSGTKDALAAFGTVIGMVFPVLMFPAAILFGLAELLIPELARCAAAGSQRRIRYLVKRGLKVALLYGCIMAGFELLLADYLCLRLYNSLEAGRFLRLYAVLIPMLYCDALTDAMTKGLGQQKACVRYNIITSLMDVILLFFLLPHYGMVGYFFSFLITHVLNFGLSLRRLLQITGCRIRPVKPLVAIGGTCFAAGMAWMPQSPVVRIGAFTIVWICSQTLTGVVGKEDLQWLKGLIVKKGAVLQK